MVSKIFFLIITIPPMPSLVDISQTAKKIKLWNNNCNDCLFVSNFTSHSRIFHSFGHVTIAGEGLQILPMLGTYGHWAVRVFLLRVNTHCDTGHPFIMVISEDPWHSGAVTTFNDLGSIPVQDRSKYIKQVVTAPLLNARQVCHWSSEMAIINVWPVSQ